MELVVVVIALASIAVSMLASFRVVQAREPMLRTLAQLAFVWVVPILGALIAIQLHRRDPQKHRLSETDDPGQVEGKIDQRSATFKPSRGERSSRDEVDSE